MGDSTKAAPDTADMQTEEGIFRFDPAVIVTVDGQTAGKATAAGQLVELKVIDCFIIKIL